jgi:predicted ATPase
MEHLLDLSINNFRAIKSANITLDGITVLSGINGCGKSTVSSLLYYVIKYSNEYEELICHELSENLFSYFELVNQIQFQMRQQLKQRNTRRPYFHNIEDAKKYINSTTVFLRSINNENDKDYIIVTKRLISIFMSTLGLEKERPLKEMIDLVIEKLNNLLNNAEKEVAIRPYNIFKKNMDNVFDVKIPKNVSIKEYGESILGSDVKNVPLPHYFRKVAYIDTPMSFGDFYYFISDNSHWRDLSSILKNECKNNKNNDINSIIENDILDGDASYEEDEIDLGFKFKRKDNKIFNLLNCATGVKSFSIIQLLLKNGFMDENALMIIDEPEAHLHPQWIIEYARLIVLLNKKMNVKFLISSHSTDMVSAIRYISEKEGVLENVAFYVAENDEKDEFSYNYRSLKHNIEPIFESFNKSYNKLDEYGEQEI